MQHRAGRSSACQCQSGSVSQMLQHSKHTCSLGCLLPAHESCLACADCSRQCTAFLLKEPAGCHDNLVIIALSLRGLLLVVTSEAAIHEPEEGLCGPWKALDASSTFTRLEASRGFRALYKQNLARLCIPATQPAYSQTSSIAQPLPSTMALAMLDVLDAFPFGTFPSPVMLQHDPKHGRRSGRGILVDVREVCKMA